MPSMHEMQRRLGHVMIEVTKSPHKGYVQMPKSGEQAYSPPPTYALEEVTTGAWLIPELA